MFHFFASTCLDPLHGCLKVVFGGGKTHDVARFFILSRQIFARHGSTYKEAKCHLHFHPENPLKKKFLFQVLFQAKNLQVHADFNFEFLGAFIGTDEWILKQTMAKVETVRKMQVAAGSLPVSQSASLLLKTCFHSCRVVHLMRTHRPSVILPALHDFDINLKDAFQPVLAHTFSDSSPDWLTFTLSGSDGGHGARTSTDYALAAYLGSLNESADFANAYLESIGVHVTLSALSGELELIREFCERYDVNEDDQKVWCPTRSQKSLSEHVDAKQRASVWAQLRCPIQRVRFMCASAPGAGAWVDARPCEARLKMTSDEFDIATRLRYGWPVFGDHHESLCPDCGEELDALGVHALHCRKNGGLWTHRHDAIRDIYFEFARGAMFGCRKEVEGLLEGAERPADFMIVKYLKGKDFVFDVTVISGYRLELMQGAAAKQLYAAAQAEKAKYRDYRDAIVGQPWKFQPLAFEALGGFGDPARFLIDTIAKRKRDHSSDGGLRAAVKRKITCLISCALARGAAELVTRKQQPKEQQSLDW